MTVLILGLMLFLGTHSVSIINPDLRPRVIDRAGLIVWQGVYGLLSLGGFLLILWGYELAHQAPIPVYDPPTWTRHLNLVLMLPVFPLLFAAYLPGRIQTKVKHPMLLAVKIWAFGHLLANGHLADLLLFGSFLAWAVADRISLKRRVGPPVQGAPAAAYNDWIALGGGLILYVLFLTWLHRALIGVSPLG